MRIGFVTPWDVADPAAWSGVVAPMFTALDERADAVAVRLPRVGHHAVDRLATRVLHSDRHAYLPDQGLATSLSSAARVRECLAAARVDVVLSVAASTQLAYARPSVPVVEVGDATFRLLSGYYPMFTGLRSVARWQGEVLGRRSARRSSAFLLTSPWAAASLVEHYGVDPHRIVVAPFGPSVRAAEPPAGPRPGAPLRLLFVGSDWHRKGGDRALEVVSALRRAGTDCELTVVGGAVPDLPAGVQHLGRVAREDMAALYQRHDALLEPARANAGGVTLTDATASGLPVVATRTGGVPAIVADGVTGVLVDPVDPVAESVAALTRLARPEVWHDMSRAARQRGAGELSWGRWADSASTLCSRVLDGR